MHSSTSSIYELLDSDPQKANELALELMASAPSQKAKDEINWARAYALTSLKRFEEARRIWCEIFDRTGDHKALHQLGYVERSAGRIREALEIYHRERTLLDESDKVAVAANLYEVSYCNLLLGNAQTAREVFEQYEELELDEEDPIERACFFRLKGDLLRDLDPMRAAAGYALSLKQFELAGDWVGASEVRQRIEALSLSKIQSKDSSK